VLILFDLDGTLFDHDTAEQAAARRLYETLTVPPMPLDAFLAEWTVALERHFARYLAGEVSFQGQRRDRIREMIDGSLSAGEADRIFTQYLAWYESSWSLYPDVLPCLDDIADYRLGLISNGQGDQQRRKLVKTGITDRFECILISEECGCAKPDPAIFARACSILGEGPADSVYIGDRYDLDAQAARAAGMRGVWLDRKKAATPDHTPPIIETLSKLRTALERAPA